MAVPSNAPAAVHSLKAQIERLTVEGIQISVLIKGSDLLLRRSAEHVTVLDPTDVIRTCPNMTAPNRVRRRSSSALRAG